MAFRRVIKDVINVHFESEVVESRGNLAWLQHLTLNDVLHHGLCAQVIRDVTNVRFQGSEPLEAALTSDGGHPAVLRTLAYSWCHPCLALVREQKSVEHRVLHRIS